MKKRPTKNPRPEQETISCSAEQSEIGELSPRWQGELQQLFAQTQVNHNAQAFVMKREPDFFRLLRYQGQRAFTLGAYQADRLWGAMTVSLDQWYVDGQWRDCAYTADLKVSPEARGQGLGDALMQGAIHLARRELNHPLIWTTVAADNPAGLRKNQKLAPLVHMQKVGDLSTVFFPCLPAFDNLPKLSTGSAACAQTRHGRLTLRRLNCSQPADQQLWLNFWQTWAPYRQGSRHYKRWGEKHFPPMQLMLGLFAGTELVGSLGLWNQQDCRQITLPRQPQLIQQYIYSGQGSVALWCGVHLAMHPGYRRALPVLLRTACREVAQRGGRLLGLAVDRQDPLFEFLPQPYAQNHLLLLSSEQPRKAYPFHAELALG